MTRPKAQHWICSNPCCASQVFVIAVEGSQAANPKCSCGSSMKKIYTAPKLRSVVDPSERKSYQERFSQSCHDLRQRSPASSGDVLTRSAGYPYGALFFQTHNCDESHSCRLRGVF